MPRHFTSQLSLLLLFILVTSSCNFGRTRVEFPSYAFTVDTLYPTTVVKSQGKSSNCWAYAMASLFETEQLVETGDTINLSPEYIVRQKYQAQFNHFCDTDGKEQIAKGGLAHTFLNTFQTEGILPWREYDSCYRSRPDYPVLLKSIRRIARKVVNEPSERAFWQSALSTLLDRQMGAIPDSFSFGGHMHTARSFAQQLPASRKEYIELTSFANHPYHTYCTLPLPDNWEHLPFYNLPLEQWIGVMVDALQQGYSFVWDGDVSEPTFSARQGMAFCTAGTVVNEQTRLDGFLSKETTDDHMMHIVGMAHNQFGERFFIAKNSSGAIGAHKGYVYLSENYVRLKTISILIDKECVVFL